MMESTLAYTHYASLSKVLEGQELESAGSQTSPQVYGQLLAIYLLFNDLTSAKFLWKRIPDRIKAANGELSTIWAVGKLMWARNYAEIYRTIDSIPIWPNHLKNIMKLITQSTRKRVIELISKAYSSISLANASQLLALDKDETLSLAGTLNWQYESDSGFLTINQHQQHHQQPQRHQICDNSPACANNNGLQQKQQSDPQKHGKPAMGLDNGSDLLENLTDYIIFLESSK